MNEREYIIFCDESEKIGKHYSNFYGGALVGVSQYEQATRRLDEAKLRLNFYGEIKWEKVSKGYLPKYKEMVSCFFQEIADRNIKVRIMFCQNTKRPAGLTKQQLAEGYFKLYYQFIKHAFGITHSQMNSAGTRLRTYFDKLPGTEEQVVQFKGYIFGLNVPFRPVKVSVDYDDIVEVRSHSHVILQCVDIVLGAIAFRLNDKHKAIPPGQTRRGNKTKAKEELYKHIRTHIVALRPNFNIGISTSHDGVDSNIWSQPYRHWSFEPKAWQHERRRTNGGTGQK